jgi:SAM-dependent methyltransferase
MTSLDHTAAPGLGARVLVTLNRRLDRLARPHYFQEEQYSKWLAEKGAVLYRQFYSKYVDLAGASILDVGCGVGGKLRAYAVAGPKRVCGIDINVTAVASAARPLSCYQVPCEFLAGDASRLPFADGSFDVAISDDGFDHFAEPLDVLQEMIRVVRPRGSVLISFVPYYSNNCSHLAEYISVPWPHVLFSRNAIRGALGAIAAERASATRPADVFNVLQTLSRMTVRRFIDELLRCRDVELVRLHLRSRAWARGLLHIAGVREPFVDAVYCVLHKQSGARVTRRALRHQRWLDLRNDITAITRRIAPMVHERTAA